MSNFKVKFLSARMTDFDDPYIKMFRKLFSTNLVMQQLSKMVDKNFDFLMICVNMLMRSCDQQNVIFNTGPYHVY